MLLVRRSTSFLVFMERLTVKPQLSSIQYHLRYVRNLRSTRGTVRSRPRANIETPSVDQVADTGSKGKVDVAGYDYFRKLTIEATGLTDLHGGDIETHVGLPVSESLVGATHTDIQPLSDLDLSVITPALPRKSFNLAPYVNDSEVLTNLVKMGVDLSKMEQYEKVADHVVKMDFDKDVKPLILLLHQSGVDDNKIGDCITKNPYLLLEPLDNMQVRINYLEAKKFMKDAIAQIITKEPRLLTIPTKETDTQLGYLQKDFMLTGDEVRLVVTRFPKIAVWDKKLIKDTKLTLKAFLGFSELELKQMMIADPKIYVTARHSLSQRFDYLHNVIGFSHKDIIRWPRVLRTRTPIVKQRHEFLKFLGRDQYDPTRENFVSPKALVLGRDVEFCENVAKVSVSQYNDFLKTL